MFAQTQHTMWWVCANMFVPLLYLMVNADAFSVTWWNHCYSKCLAVQVFLLIIWIQLQRVKKADVSPLGVHQWCVIHDVRHDKYKRTNTNMLSPSHCLIHSFQVTSLHLDWCLFDFYKSWFCKCSALPAAPTPLPHQCTTSCLTWKNNYKCH